MAFRLFLLINAVLFVRPTEIIPTVSGWPLYEVLMVACLAATFGRVQRQLTLAALTQNPLSLCVVGLFIAVILSQLSNLEVSKALKGALEFGKVLAYFLLLITVVDSRSKLTKLLMALTGLIALLALLPLLQQWAIVSLTIPNAVQEYAWDGEINEVVMVSRLQTVGLGPNELATTLVTGILLCLWCHTSLRNRMWRYGVLAFLAPLGYAFALTQSRGGLLSLMAGVLVLFHARYGPRRTVVLGAAALSLLLIAFSGRMTDTSSLEAGTGQQRLQLWSNGLMLFQENPLFGIGFGEYRNRVGYEAHNSFLHCFAELGLFGGAIFLGAFCFAAWGLARSASIQRASEDLELPDEGLWQLRPFLLAIVAAYIVGMLSLSRSYVVPTYTLLALSAVWFRCTQEQWIWPDLSFNKQFVQRSAVATAGFLLLTQVSVQFLLRW